MPIGNDESQVIEEILMRMRECADMLPLEMRKCLVKPPLNKLHARSANPIMVCKKEKTARTTANLLLPLLK